MKKKANEAKILSKRKNTQTFSLFRFVLLRETNNLLLLSAFFYLHFFPKEIGIYVDAGRRRGGIYCNKRNLLN